MAATVINFAEERAKRYADRILADVNEDVTDAEVTWEEVDAILRILGVDVQNTGE